MEVDFISNTYPDLNCAFPDAIDSFTRFEDVNADVLVAINEYYAALQSGDLIRAAQITDNNPKLKNIIIDAEKMNQHRDAVIAMERFYKSDVQKYLQNLVKFKDVFNPLSSYTKYDVVIYVEYDVTQAYMGIEVNIPVGTIPTNPQYFVPVTLRGERGESGVGLTFRGHWDKLVTYHKDDCVASDNIIWYSLGDNINSYPSSENTDWDSIVVIPEFLSGKGITLVGDSGQKLEMQWTGSQFEMRTISHDDEVSTSLIFNQDGSVETSLPLHIKSYDNDVFPILDDDAIAFNSDSKSLFVGNTEFVNKLYIDNQTKKAKPYTITTTLPISAWQADGEIYKQTVAVPGLLANDQLHACTPDDVSLTAYKNAGVDALDVVADDELMFVSECVPDVNLTIRVVQTQMGSVDAPSIMLRSGGGGNSTVVIGATAPANLKALWVDTSNKGALRYYNGTAWVFCPAVYGV